MKEERIREWTRRFKAQVLIANAQALRDKERAEREARRQKEQRENQK